jgi:hypothetical protein
MQLQELIEELTKILETNRDANDSTPVFDGGDRELVAVEFNTDEGGAVVMDFRE